MHRVRQKVFFGVCILAGVGLAVLIGLANPPSPKQLAFKAAKALGIGWQTQASANSAKGPSAGGRGFSDSWEGGGTAGSGGGPTGPADCQAKPSANPADQRPALGASVGKSSPLGTQSPLAGSSGGLETPERVGHGAQPSFLGEVLAAPAPAYGSQVAGSSGSSAASGQKAPAEKTSSAQAPSAENPSTKQPSEEIPRELLELWRQMRSGQQSSGGLGSSTETPEPASAGETSGPTTTSSSVREVSAREPQESAANPETSQNIPSSKAKASVNRPAKVPAIGGQSAHGASSDFSQRPAKTAPTTQLVQEGNGRLIINIRNEDIRKVLEMLSEQGNLNILATSSVQGKVSATLTGVDLDSALEAILRSAGYVARREGKFIYVGTPEDFLRMEQAADRIGTRVYRPNYVKASDLKDLIQPLLTEKVGLVSVSTPAEAGIASDDDKVGGNNFAGAETVLVRDYESVLAQIDQVVAEIDVRPLQVHIQAMILSVRLDDTDKFGVDFKKLINNSNFTIGWGTPVDSLSQITFTRGGLKFGFIDGDVGAFLEALESVADTNVIAAPRLMVLNKHRADILIGRQEGYVNTTQTETATTQSVQFLDIGTQLRIRPFISPDGLIRMEIHPELSDGSVTVQGNFTLPQKDVTKVTTNIMVRDGCTVVIGGLMQEQATSSVTQIPFFGNLPVVGVLFRRKTEELKRVEIIVLVTPRIVREPEAYGEGALQQCEFQRRQNLYLEKMSPLGKRSVARRYVRMAQQAWREGDMDRALRFAEMAVHFDPLNRDALEIRAQIWQRISAGPLPEEALPSPRNWTAPLDGPSVAPWIMQELEKAPTEAPVPESPLPEIPPPPDNGTEKLPPNPTRPPSSSSGMGTSSRRGEYRESSQQRGLSLGPNPVRQEEPRAKVIRRPSLFQDGPVHFP